MAAVCGTSGIASLFSQAAFAADSDIADGQTQRFDFSILQSMAHDLAQTAWAVVRLVRYLTRWRQ